MIIVIIIYYDLYFIYIHMTLLLLLLLFLLSLILVLLYTYNIYILIYVIYIIYIPNCQRAKPGLGSHLQAGVNLVLLVGLTSLRSADTDGDLRIHLGNSWGVE